MPSARPAFSPTAISIPSYGEGDGIATAELGPSNDLPQAVTIDQTGRILLAGLSLDGDQSRWALARFAASGQLDSAFAGDGTLLGTEQGRSSFGAVLVDGAGRILAGGSRWDGQVERLALARYLDDGTPDPAFGTGGWSTRAVGRYAHIGSLALDSRGRIVAGAQAYFPWETDSSESDSDVLVARYLVDGSLDPTFGSDGTVRFFWGLDFNPENGPVDDALHSLLVDEQDRISMIGLSGGASRMSRLIGDETTRIDAGPPDGSATGNSTPTFAFSSPSATATFECRFQSDDWAPCSSPQGLGPLRRRETTNSRFAPSPQGKGPTPRRLAPASPSTSPPPTPARHPQRSVGARSDSVLFFRVRLHLPVSNR